jgi:hypothetical protein
MPSKSFGTMRFSVAVTPQAPIRDVFGSNPGHDIGDSEIGFKYRVRQGNLTVSKLILI